MAWTDNSEDGSDFGVFGQRFDAAGAEGRRRVPRQHAIRPAINGSLRSASDAQGNFVVVWYGVGAGSTSATDYSIFGKRYDAAGAPLGSRLRRQHLHGRKRLRRRRGGRARRELRRRLDGEGRGQRLRRLRPALLERRRQGRIGIPREHLHDGQTDQRPRGTRSFGRLRRRLDIASIRTGRSSGVFGQRFSASGAKAGSEFQVNTYTTGYQGAARVAVDRGGNFVVVWSEDAGGGPDRNILGQRFDGSGKKVGTEFQVNTTTGALYSSSRPDDGSERQLPRRLDGLRRRRQRRPRTAIRSRAAIASGPSSRSTPTRRTTSRAAACATPGTDSS